MIVIEKREGMETSSLLQLSHMNPSMEAVDRMRLKSLPAALQGMDRDERRQFMDQLNKKEEEMKKKKDLLVNELKKEKKEKNGKKKEKNGKKKEELKKKDEIQSTVVQSKEGPLSRALANEDGFVCVRVGYRDSRFDDRSSLPSHSQTTVVRAKVVVQFITSINNIIQSLPRNQSRF